MKQVSKNLNGWANTFLLIGVLLVVLSVVVWLMEGPASSFLSGGCCCIVISPLFRGLSVLVQNAEEQIESRHHEHQTED